MPIIAFVPFDPVSYAAGLTSIRFRRFLSPPGLVSYQRLLFIPGRQHVNRRYLLVCHRTVYSVCLTVVIFMAKKIWLERQKRNADGFTAA